jgi:CRISPR-associated protein Cmr1
MRHEEGMLFGHAWPDDDRDGRGQKVAARKSTVRIRLDRWEEGKLKSWDGLEQGTVHHPETEKTHYKVGPHAYLGYGPLDGRGGTKFSSKANAAIQASEEATLSIAVPDGDAPRIERALWLMDRYGTLGGRSRNGWGSFALLPSPASGPRVGEEGALPLRDWHDALALDWPHAIGRDGNGALIWHTAPHDDWKALMKILAVIKIGLRTQFRFPNERPDGQVHDRHWLSYPVTRHSVNDWHRNNLRLPNSLRFKVRALPDGKLVGVIFHVPCLPPLAFKPDRPAITTTWQAVHTLLDELTREPKQRSYGTIRDTSRRTALKPGLDGVTLQRSAE